MPSITIGLPRAAGRRWLLAALAVGLMIGLVALLGGFQRRQAEAVSVPAGTEIDARNLVFRLDSATLQYLAKTSSEPWEVVVSGSVRNPQNETLAPITGSYGNLVAIVEQAEPRATGDFTARLGPENPDLFSSDRRVVPPNDQWMTFTATFRFDEFPETDTLDVRVVPMEFTANTVLGLSDTPRWNVDSYALPSSVMLPLTRIPDGDY
ncbi:hypothetical protein [Micropruina sp.]|uniref:hypothetical protein n=1 Tax=Micropruina sp. TaxID=2737536 RepID=UPI0039E2DE3C